MAMARALLLPRLGTMAMTPPSPWMFKQRAQSSLVEQKLAFFATLVSGSGGWESPPAAALPRRKKKPVREHPSKRRQNRKAQQENKKEQQRQQRHPKQEPKQPHQDRKERGGPKAEEDGAKKTLKKVELVKMKGPTFAPLQTKLEDTPIIQLDIKKDGLKDRFKDVTKRRHTRAKEISPGRLYNVPMTPHPNPSNPPCRYVQEPSSGYCGHSHHRIELLDSAEGNGMLVQLLIRDFDLYLIAFRRYMPGKGWSKWYFFNDTEIPDYLVKDSVMLGIGGSHSDFYNVGGHESFRLVFTEFAAYPENLGRETFREPALIAVFIFSEAFRDRWMLEELVNRIHYDLEPRPLGYYILDSKKGVPIYVDHFKTWKRLHSWSKFSGQCIHAGTEGGGWFDEEKEMKDYDVIYTLTCFEDMIGKEHGLLLVLMRDGDYLIVSKDDLEKPGAGLDSPNPGFDNNKDKLLKFYDAYGTEIPELSLS